MNEFRQLSWRLKTVFVLLLTLTITALISLVELRFTAPQAPQAHQNILAAEEEIKKIVSEVGKALLLPQDETPTLATVSDPSKLSDQPFFAHAETGDKVLIYANSRKAVLWRPSTHQVIDLSSLNIVAPQSTSTKKSTVLEL